MVDLVLRPFTSIISKLRYGQKFMLISVLFVIPIAILLFIWISSQQDELKQITAEQDGVEQISELPSFMLQVQQHRGLVNGYLNGNHEAVAQIEAKQQEIKQLITTIDTNFQKERFPVSYEIWTAVLEGWNDLHHSYESLKAGDSFDRHSVLIKQLEELIISIADESGLSLDSEINSYYMMKLIVHELPALIESTAIIRGRGNGILASNTLTDEIEVQLLVQSSISKASLSNLSNSISRIAGSDTAIYSVELVKKGEQTAQDIQNYLKLLDQEILNTQKLSMNPDHFFAEGTAAIARAGEVLELSTEQLNHALQERIDDSIKTRNVMLFIVAVILMLVVIFYVAFYRSVIETVHTLKRRAEAMANGDFSQDIVLHTRDELQLVGIAFNEMQSAMNRVLSQNQHNAASTLQSSLHLTEISHESTLTMQQVAKSVEEVLEGTNAQKRTTTEIATAMNEISIGVSRVAEAASEVASIALRANDQGALGNQQLEDTVNQMANIKKTQVTSSQIVSELDEHSARISEIITAIMEVADQTKLLALNANIEAARAGDHGRGFSVVAQEVGKLAEETSSSGQSISKLLEVIRSLVRDTVSAMHAMQQETNIGMESIERSKLGINHMINDIKLVSEQIQEVSATSEEMSAEMEEVAAAITEVANISSLTSNEAETMAAAAEEQLASMEQIQSSAEELKGMSRHLQDELSKFVLQLK
jgi:methyl-accepting chemotaxis protein